MNKNLNTYKLAKKKKIAEQVWPKNIRPKVSIICSTYNHELYVCEALDSFLMQKTNFPVEIILYDDASSDNTANIIKRYKNKYPNVFKTTFNKNNKFSKNFKQLINFLLKAKGDYIALCDGDDYWTKNNKLQKQFETLEKNNDHIFCAHLTENFRDPKIKKTEFINFKQILNEDMIAHTSSYFFKNIFKNKAIFPEYLYYGMNGDYALSVFLTQNSDCIVLPEKLSFYRLNDQGIFTSLKNNEGLIKKAQSMLFINQQIKYYFGPEIYLNLSRRNLRYILSINKRNIMSLKFLDLIHSTIIFLLLTFEFLSTYLILHFQKKHKKKTD